jgi:general secretion pathway protein A
VLEEIRLLSGVETTKEKVLRIILAGQPELNNKLDSQDLVQLKQRVRLRFHLTPLSEEDQSSYVKHRLEIAGAGGREIFEPETFPVIFRYTGGTPRLVNTLCDTALLAAFAQDHATVSIDDLRSAIDELQWVEFAARTHTHIQRVMEETAPQAQPAVGRLVLSLKGIKLTETVLVPGRLFIGRTPDNELQVDSKFVSRHHAQVVTTPEGSLVEDLNSTNGMYLHGKRVRRHKLTEGDVINLGMHDLAFFRVDAAAAEDARTAQTMLLEDSDEEDGAELEDEREA